MGPSVAGRLTHRPRFATCGDLLLIRSERVTDRAELIRPRGRRQYRRPRGVSRE